MSSSSALLVLFSILAAAALVILMAIGWSELSFASKHHESPSPVRSILGLLASGAGIGFLWMSFVDSTGGLRPFLYHVIGLAVVVLATYMFLNRMYGWRALGGGPRTKPPASL